jgi:hypothetical protein
MFQKLHPPGTGERDPRPAVASFWKGFEAHDPRLWDEDGWPVRFPHNPVAKAFRTLTFVRDGQPYVLIHDDIRKDNVERLYEWLMMTGPNTELLQLNDRDILLVDATVPRDANGLPRPKTGDRCLLVRVLRSQLPADRRNLHTQPSFRLETFERRDTNSPEGRTFGLDKRLVIASRSVEPGFTVLLFPHRRGQPLPETTWSPDSTQLQVRLGNITDTYQFTDTPDGRRRLQLSRPGQPTVAPVP